MVVIITLTSMSFFIDHRFEVNIILIHNYSNIIIMSQESGHCIVIFISMCSVIKNLIVFNRLIAVAYLKRMCCMCVSEIGSSIEQHVL